MCDQIVENRLHSMVYQSRIASSHPATSAGSPTMNKDSNKLDTMHYMTGNMSYLGINLELNQRW